MSFEVHELLLDLPVELYALCYRSGVGSADSVAYLGSGDGVLLAYEIPKPGGAVDRPISFRNAWKLPQRTKIKQIVCPVWDPGTLWLVNGDGTVSQHDAESLKLLHVVDVAKGVRKILPAPEAPSLYIATKSKLLVFDTRQRKLVAKELPITGVPLDLAWAGPDRLCLSMSDQYLILDTKVLSMDYYRLPATLPRSSEVVLLAPISASQIAMSRLDTTVIVPLEGKVEPQSELKWSTKVRALVYLHGNGIAVGADQFEVRSLIDGQLQQSEAVRDGQTLVESDHGFLVLGLKSLYEIRVVSLEEQLQSLLLRHSYDDAIELIERSDFQEERKDSEISRIRHLHAHYLFSVEHNYEAAMRLFEDLRVSVELVLLLFPQLEDPLSATLSDEDRNALSSLCRFLTNRRMAYLGRSSGSSGDSRDGIEEIPEPQRVDEALVVIFSLTDPTMATQLLRAKNACDPSFVENFITSRQRHSDVVDFFFGKGFHRRALEYLEKHLTGTEKAQSVIDYLKRLGPDNLELIFEFDSNPIRTLPLDTLQIFLDIKMNQKSSDRHAIARRLDEMSGPLCAAYLEYLISNLGDSTPTFHDKLVLEYLCSLSVQSTTESEREDIRQRLNGFLRDSNSYNAESALEWCPEDESDIRALLLSRLGDHRKALSIYIDRGMFDRAEEYCLELYRTDESSDVFVHLLDLYLERNEEARVSGLLGSYGAFVDPGSAVQRLAMSAKMADLAEFWDKSLQEIVMKGRVVQMVGRLSEAEHLQIRQEHIAIRKRRLSITGDRLCPRCGKRLGSAGFLLTQSGSLFHYTCIA